MAKARLLGRQNLTLPPLNSTSLPEEEQKNSMVKFKLLAEDFKAVALVMYSLVVGKANIHVYYCVYSGESHFRKTEW